MAYRGGQRHYVQGCLVKSNAALDNAIADHQHYTRWRDAFLGMMQSSQSPGGYDETFHFCYSDASF